MPEQPKISLPLPPGYESTGVAIIAAILTPAMMLQRAAFVGEHGQEPTPAEREAIQNAILNEWVRMTRALHSRLEFPDDSTEPEA